MGIHAGIGLNAARALCPALQAEQRDPEREQALLQRLAGWVGQFSARVSLLPESGLLLEVGGSAHLFGGLPGVLERVDHGLHELGYRARPALAPTPTAACWLARDGHHRMTTQAQLAARLATLPIGVIGLPAKQSRTLNKLGVNRIGDCLALPRAGLARRLGPQLPLLLDQALGRAPDPRPSYRPAEHFEASLTLADPLQDCHDLLLMLRRLILELSGFLLARSSAVERVELHLFHQRLAATRLMVGLADPSRDPERLLSVLRQRLERVQLQEPVTEVGLAAPRLLRLTPEPGSLFDHAEGTASDSQRLLETLRARLGRDAVNGLCLRPDHRPEKAWGYCEPGERVVVNQRLRRPLWLLNEPRPLPSRTRQPDLPVLPGANGALQLEHGPERIETGWWDGDEVARDYYLARHSSGERYWLFRERQAPRRWFIHGMFA